MQTRLVRFALMGCLLTLGIGWRGAWSDDPQANDRPASSTGSAASAHATTANADSAQVILARERAKLMYEMSSATLEVMHQHYFHVNKAVLPARAMEDVFSEVNQQTRIKARWIAVNTKAMSVHHEPKTDFEKKAASEIAAGKSSYEAIEGGQLLRAGVIPLTAGCVNCHSGGFTGTQPKSPRFAALVVSVPLAE